MTSVLKTPTVASVLEREHGAARAEGRARAERRAAEGSAPPTTLDFRTSELHRSAYLAISPRQGRWLYGLARATSAREIVEFGTSHGISTLYLAAAAAETDGRVTGSEFHPAKAEKARANLRDAGLADRGVSATQASPGIWCMTSFWTSSSVRESCAAIRPPI